MKSARKPTALALLALVLTCSMSAPFAAAPPSAPDEAPTAAESTQMREALQQALQDERAAHKKDTEALSGALQKLRAELEMCRARVGKSPPLTPPK
jgi:Skp family chaperone for outer membrane proteins